jgi:hypothetical protein
MWRPTSNRHTPLPPFKMSFLRNLFRRTPMTAEPTVALPNYQNHMGAGCVFSDGKHVLAGYQPNKKKPGITGIGGHKEGEETYLQTAYRETIEEIFHVTITSIPVGLIDKLIRCMKPKKIKIKKGYVLITFTFTDLDLFLKVCKKAGLRSPLYAKLPVNLIEVIQKRGYDLTAEISSFALLPVVKSHTKLRNFVNPLFIQDMLDM